MAATKAGIELSGSFTLAPRWAQTKPRRLVTRATVAVPVVGRPSASGDQPDPVRREKGVDSARPADGHRENEVTPRVRREPDVGVLVLGHEGELAHAVDDVVDQREQLIRRRMRKEVGELLLGGLGSTRKYRNPCSRPLALRTCTNWPRCTVAGATRWLRLVTVTGRECGVAALSREPL